MGYGLNKNTNTYQFRTAYLIKKDGSKVAFKFRQMTYSEINKLLFKQGSMIYANTNSRQFMEGQYSDETTMMICTNDYININSMSRIVIDDMYWTVNLIERVKTINDTKYMTREQFSIYMQVVTGTKEIEE